MLLMGKTHDQYEVALAVSNLTGQGIADALVSVERYTEWIEQRSGEDMAKDEMTLEQVIEVAYSVITGRYLL